MKTPNSLNPTCRHCRYYMHQGRRGGHCQQLSVAVKSEWKACSLAIPPFTPAWESLEGIMAWQQKALAAMQESTVTGSGMLMEVSSVDGSEPLPASLNSTV